MNLDFLRVGGAVSQAIARSPMEPKTRAAGARFEVRDGWNVAVDYAAGAAGVAGAGAGAAVGWADTSHLAKLELQGAGAAIEAAAGTPLPLGTAVRQDDAWWCRLTATRALVLGAAPAARERISGAGAIKLVDVTTNFAALTIAGPAAREVFARFCALDLRPAVTPVGALRPGSIGRQPGILVCEAPDRYLFLFGWATGEYMWSMVADAGEHLGGAPIGLDALGALAGGPAADDRNEASVNA